MAQVEVFKAMGIIEPSGAKTTSATPATPAPTEAPKPEPVAAAAAPALNDSANGRKFYTPVVRSIATQHGISEDQLAAIIGTGEGGRVTKKDVEGYLAAGSPAPAKQPVVAAAPVPKPAAPTIAGPDQELVPLVGLRKMIADAMIRSSQIPTVSTVTQVDVTSMVHFREKNKETFLETYGVKLTPTPFFIKALTETPTGVSAAEQQPHAGQPDSEEQRGSYRSRSVLGREGRRGADRSGHPRLR